MAYYSTIGDALDEAFQEINMFHQGYGFPDSLTHHTSGDGPRNMSHNPNVVDYGNWTGSVVMYALLFEYGLIKLFDQTGQRAEVYRNWGSEHQSSGKGPDNARTNLLEAILGVMLEETHHDCSRGARTQRVWFLMYKYTLRYRHNAR